MNRKWRIVELANNLENLTINDMDYLIADIFLEIKHSGKSPDTEIA